jgi:beta-fructofuranosidase
MTGKRIEADIPERAYELDIRLDGPVETFDLLYRNEVRISFDSTTRKFTVERTNWATSLRETRSATLCRNLKNIAIYTEETSMEIFINGGEEVFSLRYFAKDMDSKVTAEIEGINSTMVLELYRLGSVRK